jgi:hypothetical protein
VAEAVAGVRHGQAVQLRCDGDAREQLETVAVRAPPTQHRLGQPEFGGPFGIRRIHRPAARVLAVGQGAGHRLVPPEHLILRSGQCPGGIVGSGPGQDLPHVPESRGIMVPGVALPPVLGRHRSAQPDRVLRGTNQAGASIAAGAVRWSMWMGCLSSASYPDTADHFRGHGVGPYARSFGWQSRTYIRLCHVREVLSPFVR